VEGKNIHEGGIYYTKFTTITTKIKTQVEIYLATSLGRKRNLKTTEGLG
jgi:hypothetical protein